MKTFFSNEVIIEELTKGPTFGSTVNSIRESVEKYHDSADARYTGYACIGTDLDQTMAYSPNSMNLPDEMPQDLLLRVIEIYNNKPLSHTTALAYMNLEMMNRFAGLVPVTTRTEKQFKRLKMPGSLHTQLSGQRTQYAVTTNGAKILVNGTPDSFWHEKILTEFEHSSIASVGEVKKRLSFYEGMPWLESINKAEGMFFYMVVKPNHMPQHVKEDLRKWMDERNWNMSAQGRKVYFVPNFISKGKAFLEVVSRIGADYTMTSGDSLLDIPLLEVADLAFRPRHGELETKKYHQDNLVVTNAQGILAGEEITARMLAQISHSA